MERLFHCVGARLKNNPQDGSGTGARTLLAVRAHTLWPSQPQPGWRESRRSADPVESLDAPKPFRDCFASSSLRSTAMTLVRWYIKGWLACHLSRLMRSTAASANHRLVVTRKMRSNSPKTLRSGRSIVMTTTASAGPTIHAIQIERDREQRSVPTDAVVAHRVTDRAEAGGQHMQHGQDQQVGHCRRQARGRQHTSNEPDSIGVGRRAHIVEHHHTHRHCHDAHHNEDETWPPGTVPSHRSESDSADTGTLRTSNLNDRTMPYVLTHNYSVSSNLRGRYGRRSPSCPTAGFTRTNAGHCLTRRSRRRAP